MAETYNGVIETSTGDLLRAGYCDFENDGSFNPEIESYMTSIPNPGKTKGSPFFTKMDRWTGSGWIEVDQ